MCERSNVQTSITALWHDCGVEGASTVLGVLSAQCKIIIII